MNTHTPLQTTQINNTNNKRIAAFDLARGLPILFMIIIHVLSFYGSPTTQQGMFASTVHFLIGWPSASIFVFMMGVFVAYSNSQNLTLGLQRATALFLLGYCLNLFRETIPTLLSLEIGLVTYEQLGKYTPLNGLLVVDILQNAGLAYATCIVLKHFIPHAKAWLAIAVMVAFGSPLLWDIHTNIPTFDHILKIFWGNKDQGALFPLFPWLSYPIIGMAFGYWFKHTSHVHKKLFTYTLILGITLFIVGSLITLLNTDFHIADKMRHGPRLIVIMTGVILMWLWLFNLLTCTIKHNKGFALLYFWSKHVTAMYVIHWLYVGWGLMIFGSQQLSLVSVLWLILAVGILSDLSLRVWLFMTRAR